MAHLKEAVRLLEQGDWAAAHTIAQQISSPQGSWAHGIVHLMEGDLDNAGYWYRRAGRVLVPEARVAEEIEALKRDLKA